MALRAALEILPAIASDTAELRSLYMELFQTNCFLCIKGMVPEKCQRCRFEPESPHSKEISFEKCVDVLAEFGLRLDTGLERAAQQEIFHPLQVGLVDRLRMQGKLIARRKKLAGEATRGVENLRIGSSGGSGDAAPASANGSGGSGGAENGAPGKGKKKKKKAVPGAPACGVCEKSDVKILRCSKCNVAGYCSPGEVPTAALYLWTPFYFIQVYDLALVLQLRSRSLLVVVNRIKLSPARIVLSGLLSEVVNGV